MNSVSAESARKKWCPFARTARYRDANERRTEPVSINRGSADLSARGCLCLADGCQLWVWDGATEGGNGELLGHCGLGHTPAGEASEC